MYQIRILWLLMTLVRRKTYMSIRL